MHEQWGMNRNARTGEGGGRTNETHEQGRVNKTHEQGGGADEQNAQTKSWN